MVDIDNEGMIAIRNIALAALAAAVLAWSAYSLSRPLM